MPYIEQSEKKNGFDEIIAKFMGEFDHKGELEYCVFALMKVYMENKKMNYNNLHDCVYAVQHCADEFRRRFLNPHEDEAIQRNGDVRR